jgi:uncharacterized protein (UPF0332 family)
MPFQDLSSNKYWHSNDKRIAQKFYIGFCLSTSAAADLAVAYQLKDTNKLNWSTAAGYYSMVHSSRLIMFIGAGDFPISHSALVGFYKNNKDCTGDWFKKLLGSSLDIEYSSKNKIIFADLMEYYFNTINFRNVKEYLKIIGPIISKAIALRNDSNYEALIMAHEYQHDYISDDFQDLSKAMLGSARIILSIAIKCFIQYLLNDRMLEGRRNLFRCFASEYAQKRIIDSIMVRCGAPYVDLIRSEISELIFEDSSVVANQIYQAQGLETEVSYNIFGAKSVQMLQFRDKINKLAKEYQNLQKPHPAIDGRQIS